MVPYAGIREKNELEILGKDDTHEENHLQGRI